MNQLDIVRDLIDVNPLWIYDDNQTDEKVSTSAWLDAPNICRALSYLSQDERRKIARFRNVHNAKMALASCLMKRKMIQNITDQQWSTIEFYEDTNRKPHHRACSSSRPVAFNISHDHGLVVMVSSKHSNLKLGVDIVHINLSINLTQPLQDGSAIELEAYQDVLHPNEISAILQLAAAPNTSEKTCVDNQVRLFCAHWCLKEAYVKMTGEGLRASYLKELELRKLCLRERPLMEIRGEFLQATQCEPQAWVHGQHQSHVRLDLLTFGSDFFIATAASDPNASFCPFDVLPSATSLYPTMPP